MLEAITSIVIDVGGSKYMCADAYTHVNKHMVGRKGILAESIDTGRSAILHEGKRNTHRYSQHPLLSRWTATAKCVFFARIFLLIRLLKGTCSCETLTIPTISKENSGVPLATPM